MQTLDNMVKRGEIKAVRYGGRTMIPLYELARLLETSTTVVLTSYEHAWAADHHAD